MSETPRDNSVAKTPPPRRSLAGRMGRGFAWAVLGLVLFVLVLLVGISWYTTTSDFERRVHNELVSTLEEATGGRVELQGIHLKLWKLAVEADGLVIHGLEGPGEAPYLEAHRVLLELKLNDVIARLLKRQAASIVSVRYLRVEQPHVHFIIDKDGKTNQPVPKKPSTSTTPVQDTLLDLQARKVELVDGLAVVNDRAIPFDLAAQDLQAEVHYIDRTDRYGATVDLNNLRTRMAKEPEAQSKLHVQAELGRDAFALKTLDFLSGMNSKLHAEAAVNHFNKPEWQGSVRGTLALQQISILAGVAGLNAGTLDLDVKGHNCAVEPAEAQRQPHFWQRHHPKETAKPSTKVLPPDPTCTAGYLALGEIKLHDAGYRDQYVRLHDINGGAQLRVTPTELLFTALTGYLPGGGSAVGELRISNWLGEVPPSQPAQSPTTVAAAKTANKTAVGIGAAPPIQSVNITPVQRAHALLNVTINRISLRTILDITAQKMNDLGFDTAISGPVKAEWGGPATNIADTVNVDGDLRFAPTGVRGRGALANIPVTGQVLGHYRGATEIVNLERFTAQTPQSTLEASGVLGVNRGDPLTSLRLDLLVHDLGEYDQLLQTVGFESNGKKGSAAIPVILHGALAFNGTAKGALRDLDLKGHLQATDLAVHLGSEADVHVDSVIADAEYAPRTGLAVASSTIKRGSAVLTATGAAQPRRQVSRHGTVSYVWDDGSTVNGSVHLNNASLTDVLEIAGQKDKYPVTGTLSLNAQAQGQIRALSGSGEVKLTDGAAYGERFESVLADVTVRGKDVEASQLLVKLHGMQITGNGGYNLASERFHGHLQGDHLQLSKFDTVQAAKLPVDGTLDLRADANGSVTEPGLTANVHVGDVTSNGQPLGELNADVRSQGNTVYLTSTSTLVGAQLQATGSTQLTGDYPTQAKLTITGLDISKPLAIFSPSTIKAQSAINGVITVNGPAKTPALLRGTAELNPVDVKVEGLELRAENGLHASLANGTVTLEPLHITGQDTDFRASGTAQVLGSTDPKGGALHVKATGSVNTAIAHTFAPTVTSDGTVSFEVAADGKLKEPALTGRVDFKGVNAALQNVSNGLTNLNGTMVFNEDRLNVQNLTATTGGGLVKLGGYVAYSGGIFADLTATAEKVRVRLNGLSTTANASFRLQGSSEGAVLSGNVLVTRFNVGPDVDFAAFSGGGSVSAPPDPSSFTNKVRLDIHVASSPQLDFQNSFAKLAGTVDLNVRGTIAEPQVLGRIQITDGSATFAGTTYQLQRGDLYFTNPVRIDPIVDLDATARVENYDITIGVHGTSANLKPTYRSEPPLSEADIFNLLALGKTQEEAQISNTQAQQAGTDPTTNALLGGALNATVSNRVSKLFGGGSVKIDPAYIGTLGNTGPRITVQQQLSRQISVVFATNVTSSQQQLVQLNYAINENSSIVMTRDETGVFSIVYKIRKRYR